VGQILDHADEMAAALELPPRLVGGHGKGSIVGERHFRVRLAWLGGLPTSGLLEPIDKGGVGRRLA
jgi:hypothetical protein